VLSPYIATVVIGDPVRGQEMLSRWHTISGLTVALTAPLLGASADRLGRRKPLLAGVLAILVVAMAAQYWAMPGEAGLPLWAVGAAVIVAGVTFTWTEVLHNSMLPTLAEPRFVPHVSGLGFALGNLSSLLLLVFVLWGIALPGQMALPFLPERPLFGLDPRAFETNRSVALICAGWAALFALPLFVYTRDRQSSGERFAIALRHGLSGVISTVRKLKDHRHITIFLIARMLYVDGKIAILIFSGVYAAGVMGWGLIEMLTFGIILSVFAVVGGLIAGRLDDWLGSKKAVLLEVGVTLACLIVMVSMSRGAIFFIFPVSPEARLALPLFDALPEFLYLCAAMVIAVSITAAFASSRTLMARLSPRGMEGELFGLYALAGSATAWLGPLLVERFTRIYESQRAGFAAIGLLLAAGFVLMLFMRQPREV
jgi:UMF1 family MFS transporter